MKNKAELSHKEFVSLIAIPENGETKERVRNLREQDLALNSLFEIIEEMRNQVHIETEADPKILAPKSFDEIEDLLLRIFSGDYQPSEAQNFVNSIFSSPLFYQRVLLKLRQLAMVTAAEDIPEIANVRVKSNKEILESFILADTIKHEKLAPFRKQKGKFEDLFEKLQNLLFPPKALPKYALAFAVVIVLGIMIPNISSNLSRQNLLDNYLTSVNYERSALRASSPQMSGSAEVQSFLNNFELAMGDFLTCSYAEAIRDFKILEPKADDLRSAASDKRVLSLIRNYYFYYGYSHLALAKPGLIDFKEGNERQHVQEAARFFLISNSIAEKHKLDNLQRENYFIALATGLSGKKEHAIQILRQINKGSEYYRDAERLIQEWAN